MIGRALRWLQSKFWSIVLSLVFAITIWVTANQEVNPVEERTLAVPVPIEIVGLDDDLLITNEVPTETRLRLRAQSQTWPSLSAEDVVARADLAGLEPGTYQVELQVEVFAQAVLVASNPAQIRVILEENVSCDFPISVELEGRPPVGYRAGTPEIDPESVTVQGPASQVNLIDEIRITIPIQDQRDTYQESLPLVAYDADGNVIPGMTFRTSLVDVLVPITQVEGFKDVAVRVATTGQPDRGYFVTGPSVTPTIVTLQGDPSIIDGMPPLVETLLIDLNGLTDDLIVEIGLSLPEGVTADPDMVEVIIPIAAQQGGRSLIVPVQVDNVPDGFVATISPEEVEVFLSGPLPVLDDITADNISVVLDLSGQEIGAVSVAPGATIDQASVTIESVLPAAIEVDILPEGIN